MRDPGVRWVLFCRTDRTMHSPLFILSCLYAQTYIFKQKRDYRPSSVSTENVFQDTTRITKSVDVQVPKSLRRPSALVSMGSACTDSSNIVQDPRSVDSADAGPTDEQGRRYTRCLPSFKSYVTSRSMED